MKVLFMNAEIELTEKQVKDITHCLGLDQSKDPYRNRYNCSDNESWNSLVNKGLATKRKVEGYAGDFMYCVNTIGISFVQAYPKEFNLDKKWTKMSADQLKEKFEI